LAKAIIRMVKDNEFAGRVAEAGRLKVERGFSVEAMVDGCVGVYSGL